MTRFKDRDGGEAGIRTLDTGLSPYNGLANRRLRPLGHLTVKNAVSRCENPRAFGCDADFRDEALSIRRTGANTEMVPAQGDRVSRSSLLAGQCHDTDVPERSLDVMNMSTFFSLLEQLVALAM